MALLLVSSKAHRLCAQELVFPITDLSGKKSVSDNGKYLTVLNNDGLLAQVDVASGAVICSQKIDIPPGVEVIMKTSYYGNYVMLLALVEEMEIKCFIVEFMGSEGFEEYENFDLSEYYSSDGGTIMIESNPAEDFTVKAFNEYPEDAFSFIYYIRFHNTDEGFFPYLELGSTSRWDFGDIGGSPIHMLDKVEARIYDISESERSIVLLTDYRIDDDNFAEHGSYAYGMLRSTNGKGKSEYERLFNDAEFGCADEFCGDYAFEYGIIKEMKIDEVSDIIYGHAKSAEMLKKICIDFQIDRGDGVFDETLYQEICNYYDASGDATIPFVYDISDSRFYTVLGNEDLEEAEYRATNPWPLPRIFRKRRISYDLKHGLYVRENEASQFVFYRLDLETGETDSLVTQLSSEDFYCHEITNDNKAMLWYSSRESDKQLADHPRIIVFDFNTMRVKNKLMINPNERVLHASQVKLYKAPGSSNVLVCSEQGDTVNFNFSELPFFSSGAVAAEAYAKRDTVAASTRKWATYDVDQYYVEDQYQHSYYEWMEYSGAEPLIPFNYAFERYSMIIENGPETDELGVYDDAVATGYANLLYSIDPMFEFHEASQRLYVRNYYTVDKFNPDANANEFVYIKHNSPIRQFDVLENDSLMVTLSHDGEINIWNVAFDKLLATLYLFEDGKNWVFVLPDNYYYGTQPAVERVAFAFDKIVFPMEFFELRYNRPDIVLAALGSKNQTLINAYHRAYLKRLQKLGLREEMLRLDYDVPYLHITNREMIPLELEADSIQIDLNMYDLRYNLDRINVWVNDVAIYGANGKNIRDLGLKFYKISIQVPLAHGENNIQVSTLNESGSESFKETIQVRNTGGKKKPDLYLIAIGVSKYQDERYNLTYAAKDAQDVAKAFQESKYYTEVYSKTLLNEEVTLEQIFSLKDFFKNAGINDQVIVFIAGHGVLDADINYYFASHDMDFIDPAAKGIPYEMIEKLLDGIKPLKKLLLMDTCHSGEVDKDDVEIVESDEQKEDDLVWREAGVSIENKEVQLGLQNTSELMKSLFTDMRKGTGATVISSAGGVELAMESATWKNGLFTYCLINGLTSLSADLDTNGEITVSELKNFVQMQVQLLSLGKQTPTSRIENHALDYRVW